MKSIPVTQKQLAELGRVAEAEFKMAKTITIEDTNLHRGTAIALVGSNGKTVIVSESGASQVLAK